MRDRDERLDLLADRAPDNRPQAGRNRERECAEILSEWLPRVLEMLTRKAIAGDRIAARIIARTEKRHIADDQSQ